MCGIFAYLGTETDVAATVFSGLKELEYRGYDSWGIVVGANGSTDLYRDVGKLPVAAPRAPRGTIGLGHTRWATTGGVEVRNAHPHLIADGKLAVVHNGVVENYLELRQELDDAGVSLLSDTDTEVVGKLIETEIESHALTVGEALRNVASRVEGLNAFVVADLVSGEIAGFKTGSPLYLGRSGSALYVASDPSAILPHTNRIRRLNDGELVQLSEYKSIVFDTATGSSKEPDFEEFLWNRGTATLGRHPYFLEKEIFEQPGVLESIAADTESHPWRKAIETSKEVIVTGCGTAYFAGLFASYLFQRDDGPRVRAVHAHEMPYLSSTLRQGDCIVALSQSGETIDVIDAVRIARERTDNVVALVNVPGSSLTHEVGTHGVLGAGPERAVLSTKAYMAKVAQLLRVARPDDAVEILKSAARAIRTFLHAGGTPRVEALSEEIGTRHNMFVLGTGLLHPVALEGALKIKEVSYLHAEGFPAGELKHGVIALIEPGTPVIAIVPEGPTRHRVLTAIQEVRARGAFVIGISREKESVFDRFLPVEAADVAFALAAVVPMQMLGYKLAVLKGLDPDKPRNLAKSVTVR